MFAKAYFVVPRKMCPLTLSYGKGDALNRRVIIFVEALKKASSNRKFLLKKNRRISCLIVSKNQHLSSCAKKMNIKRSKTFQQLIKN